LTQSVTIIVGNPIDLEIVSTGNLKDLLLNNRPNLVRAPEKALLQNPHFVVEIVHRNPVFIVLMFQKIHVPVALQFDIVEGSSHRVS